MPTKPTPTSKTLFRVHISFVDFSQAIRFIDTAQKQPHTSDEWWGLMLAAIACYARPFSGNERRGTMAAADSNLEVDARMLRGLLGKSDRKLHRRIIRLRKKAVAHSESKYFYLRVLKASWPADPTLLASEIAFKSAHWHPFNEQIDLVAFRRIANVMRAYCQFGRFDFGHKVAHERKRLRTK